MRTLHQIEEWQLVIPHSYPIFRKTLEKYLPEAESLRILIVDDIDADGFGSAKIAKSKLSRLFDHCDIYMNTQHGFTDLEKAKKYDLVFILDSSSNLLETYTGLNQVFILDHHEYNHEQKCPDNVCFINSKDTPQLKSISAGMLCYLVFTQFLKDQGIDDDSLFDIACMTLYSDVVPLDDYVQSCLYKFMKMEQYSDLLTCLNIYKDTMNKNTLSYTIIPLINYTRRLGDTITLSLLYGDNEDLAIHRLLNNKKRSKEILDLIDRMGKEHLQHENFTFWDISLLVNNIPQLPVANFKGVYANKIVDKTQKPALVGFTKDNLTQFSVRSPDKDSLSFFSTQEITGGGHKSACGFQCLAEDLDRILELYDTYIKTADKSKRNIIVLNSIDDLQYFNLTYVALYNEFLYSSGGPITFAIQNINTKDITNMDLVRYRFTIGEYSFISYKDLILEGFVDIKITPTLSSYKLGTRKLVTEMTEHIKEV